MLLHNVEDYTADNAAMIWDGLFSTELLEEVYSLREQPLWEFNNGHPPKKSWCIDICNYGLKKAKYNSMEDIINFHSNNWDQICKDYPFVPIVWKKVSTLTKYDLKLARTWINGHTYGLGDTIHSDQDENGSGVCDWNEAKGITWLLYCNPQWSPDAGGETKFYRKNGDLLKSVSAMPGRLIAFDPRLLHKGESPSRYCPDLRVTLTFHTRFEGEI